MATRMQKHLEATDWALVRKVSSGDDAGRLALDQLCRKYWGPLYVYARSQGRDRHTAEDLVQSFFLLALRRNLFERADEQRGRLRNYLLTAFKRHMTDSYTYESRAKRALASGATVAFSEIEALEGRFDLEADAGRSPEARFDREWALTLLRTALKSLEERYVREEKAELFHVLRPLILEEGGDGEREAVASTVNLSPSAFSVALHRLRKRHRETLQTIITETVDNESEAENEFRYLAQVLEA